MTPDDVEMRMVERMPSDLAVLGTLQVPRAPAAVLAEAHEAAAALKGVIDAKPHKVQFGGETYLEFEDWQTVGRFYGIAPRITSSHYVEFGPVAGWEARAEAVHVETGKVVSSADSMCLNDEEKWRARPKYEWHYAKKSGGTSAEDPGRDELVWEKGADGKSRPKKTRIRLADEPVPLFQLRSMAQTRACAKALRNACAWVVVLAGYKPTPAEELEPSVVASAPRVIDVATGEVLEPPPMRGGSLAALTARLGARPAPVPTPEPDPEPDPEPEPDPAAPSETELALKRSWILARREKLKMTDAVWARLLRQHTGADDLGQASLDGLDQLELALGKKA